MDRSVRRSDLAKLADSPAALGALIDQELVVLLHDLALPLDIEGAKNELSSPRMLRGARRS